LQNFSRFILRFTLALLGGVCKTLANQLGFKQRGAGKRSSSRSSQQKTLLKLAMAQTLPARPQQAALERIANFGEISFFENISGFCLQN